MTTNIFARTSQQQAAASTIKNKNKGTAETAGSLASKAEKSYLAVNTYDTIQINSPYSLNIDFSNYSNFEDGSSANSGFLGGFANAVAMLGTDCSGLAAAGAGACTSSGSVSCGGGGGFTSFV